MSAAVVGFTPLPGTDWSSGVEPQIAAALNKLAHELGINIVGISGGRTPQHSEEVGGSAKDPHAKSEAGDIGVNGATRVSAAQLTNAQLESVGLERPFDKHGEDPNEINHVQLKKGGGGSGILGDLLSPANAIIPGGGLALHALKDLGLPNPIEAAGDVVKGAAGDATSSLAQGVVNDVIGWAEPTALKLLLYVTFIFGGIALAGYGLATMLKPMPPDIVGGARKAGKAIGLAAVAE